MIILLNGTSSSGKTTIARVLQEKYPGVLLLYGVDTMVQNAFPAKCDLPPFNEQAIKVINGVVDGQPAARLLVSPFMYPVYRSAVDFYRTLSEQGYDLIVDELLFDPRRISPYFEILADQKVYFVAIKPAKDIVIQREKARGDRLPGLAAGLYDEVYQPLFSFDLVVDSGRLSAEQSADLILSFVNNNPEPSGFKTSARRWKASA